MKRLQIRRGTTAQRTAITGLHGEPFWDETLKALYAWDQPTTSWKPCLTVATVLTPAYHTALAPSAAGNTTVQPTAVQVLNNQKITAAGGSGVYTYIFVLGIAVPPATGAQFRVAVELPASSNPTIEIRNATTGGTLLATMNNLDGVSAIYWRGDFVFNGTAWEFQGGFYQQN